ISSRRLEVALCPHPERDHRERRSAPQHPAHKPSSPACVRRPSGGAAAAAATRSCVAFIDRSIAVMTTAASTLFPEVNPHTFGPMHGKSSNPSLSPGARGGFPSASLAVALRVCASVKKKQHVYRVPAWPALLCTELLHAFTS
ncbi:unnamed protein product, partial [Ectocarpus sp. 12 AP-2014]